MTTPTNDRQTSERERLAAALEFSSSFGAANLFAAAAQLRADEAEIAQLRTDMQQLRVDLARERLTHTETTANLAAADEQARVSDEIIAALRAENEALRTVTEEDVLASCRIYAQGPGNGWQMPGNQMRDAIQSFIRSKESRRG